MRAALNPLLPVALATLLVLGSCSESEEPGGPAIPPVRILLLGLEGADLDIIDALKARGELPAFARLEREGAWGKLESVLPLLPPVGWTSIATGRPPEDTGVHDYTVEDASSGRILPITSFMRRTEAIWDILGDAGRKVGAVGWPGTWPVEPVNGFMVSDRMELLEERSKLDDYLWPRDLAEDVLPRARRARSRAAAEVARFVDLPTGGEEVRQVRDLRSRLNEAETGRAVALALWKGRGPAFMAWQCELPGAVSLDFLPYAPPKRAGVAESEFVRYRRAADEAYRHADRIVADALEAADDDTVVLVVSNCGTRGVRQRLRRPAAPDERAAVEWRRRFGAFFAWGKGVRAGRVVGAKSEDIVPSVLGLAGLPLAEDMPGRFLSEAFETSAPEAVVRSYEKGRPVAIRKALHLEGERAYTAEDPLNRTLPGSVLPLQSPLNRGLYYLREQDHNAARWYLRLARQRDPESVRALYSSAFLNEGRDRLLLAETGYREVIRINPGFTAAHLRLALVLRKTGREEEALVRARHAAAIEPALSEARLLLGVFFLAAGREREGEAELLKAVELEPDFLEARNRLGIHLLDQGRFAEAATHFQAAVDLDPGYLRAWNNLGVSLLRHAAQSRGDPRSREEILDRALRTFDLTIERFPGYPKPFYNRARLRLIRGQRDLAARDAAKALELDPDYADARRLVHLLEEGRAPPR